jgi:hypothetical protein
MTAKKEPLKLMPLDEFKKFVQAIVRVPKETVEKSEPEKSEAPRRI